MQFLLLLALGERSHQQPVLPPPIRLRVEGLAPPVVLSVPHVTFSFVAVQNRSNSSRGLSQAGYRVTVYKNLPSGQQLLWDSGRVASPRYSQIACGAALPPFSDFTFEAEWWRSDGAVSAKSSMPFETGPFSAADWGNAAFLGGTLLRAQLQIPANSTVQRARAFVAAPGCHALEVNGQQPPMDLRGICPFMQPGSGQAGPQLPAFSPRLLYQTHNVTSLLHPGMNAIGLLSGHVFTLTPSIVFMLRVESMTIDKHVAQRHQGSFFNR